MYSLVVVSGGQKQYYIMSSWHSQECNWECWVTFTFTLYRYVTHSNRKSYIFWSCLQNTSTMQDPESRNPPRNKYLGSTTGKWHQSPMQPHINIWHYFTVVYLHDLITYSFTKCMEMLSGLFPIQTDSLISFHQQSSILLHQGTTFKELLSLVFYKKEQYYVRSAWHLHSCIRSALHLRMQM